MSIQENLTISDKKRVKEEAVAAAAIIYKRDDQNKPMILLIQRSKEDHWPNMWEVPRGRCKKGESLEDCLRREVKEETNLDVNVLKFIDKIVYLADNGKRETHCYNFLCSLKNPDQEVRFKVTPDTGVVEHQDYMWITQSSFGGLLVMPELRKIIEQVLINPVLTSLDKTLRVEETIDLYLNTIYGG